MGQENKVWGGEGGSTGGNIIKVHYMHTWK